MIIFKEVFFLFVYHSLMPSIHSPWEVSCSFLVWLLHYLSDDSYMSRLISSFCLMIIVLFPLLESRMNKVKLGIALQYNDVMGTISSLFIFFTKRFREHKKHKNVKQTTFTLLEVQARKKLLSLLFSASLFLFCWFIFVSNVVFCARNLLVKKNKEASNCPNNLIILYY